MDEEQELLAQAEAYESLRAHPGFVRLLSYLRERVDYSLMELRRNTNPSLDGELLNRWRERASLLEDLEQEIDTAIADAKEIENARAD